MTNELEVQWLDRRKKYTITFRVTFEELLLLEQLRQLFNESRTMAIIRALWAIRILYDPNLKLKDAVKEIDPDKPLGELLKPLPELASIINIHKSLWQGRVTNNNTN